MEVLLIKDTKGKEHLVFKRENKNELDDMGGKVDDFEILQVLGEGSFGYIAKVKSLLNHKIYAMKKIDLSKIKEDKVIKLMENETKVLADLDNPLVVKYYKSFKEDGALFIIMEFMDNGDIGGILKASKTLDKPIPEEKIYDIFIQSMKGLTYIHSKNLIHRDIKPDNLFITVDGTVKLGDFGVSAALENQNNNDDNKNNFANINELNQNKNKMIGAVKSNNTVVGTPLYMSPEMLNYLKYDLKTDVYSMGVTFFIICFWDFPRKPVMDMNLEIKINDMPIQHNENYYSKELVDIIFKMIEKDKNKRPTSEEALNMLVKEFNKKYAKVSSIGSVLCGIYSMKSFSESILKPERQQFITQNPVAKPISFAFLYGINSIKQTMNVDWNNSLYNIKNIFKDDNYIFGENREMEPRHILSYLLRKLHKELGMNNSNNIPINRTGTLDKEDINKEAALKKFLSIPFTKSPIFNYFYGIMKSKSACCSCSTPCFCFNYFYHVSFSLELALKSEMNLSMEKLFDIQNNVCIKLHQSQHKICSNCKSVQEFWQRKQFYTLPPLLIVCLDRGFNCQYKNKISYNLQLILDNQVENKIITSYELSGIVKRLDNNGKEHYICVYFDYNLNSWILRNDSQIVKLNSPFDSKEGIEMIFFYRSIQNNIPKQNSF